MDAYIQTIEIPINAIASAAAQDTGVAMPGTNSVLISAVIEVDTLEATAAAKTVDVGLVGGTGAELINDADVSAAGWTGAPVITPLNTTANISFTLAGADFAELVSTAILTFQAKG
jgi:hypothetical protein